MEDKESIEIPSSLTPEQEAILDETLALDEKGLLTYSSWEEVKARIISKDR